MRGSLKLATIYGIPLLLHWSFGLLFVWLGYVGFSEGMDAIGILWFFFFAILLFGCVVIHEFGHALTALKFGVKTKDIILSPLGGLARLKRLPDKPIHEFLIAIAGPATNVVIAILLFPVIYFSGSMSFVITDTADVIFTKPANLIPMLFYANITLVIFNMIPAFPMDGGRVLRSLLAMGMDRYQATRVAVVIGQVFGLTFLMGGIFMGELILGLIGIFVFLMATAELQSAKTESLLDRQTVSDIMRSRFSRITRDQKVGELAAYFMTGMEISFLVFENDGYRFAGILNSKKIEETLRSGANATPVGDVMEEKIAFLTPTQSLKNAYYKLMEEGVDILPVLSGREIIGVVDRRGLNAVLQKRVKGEKQTA